MEVRSLNHTGYYETHYKGGEILCFKLKEKSSLLSIQLKFENILHVVKLAYFWRTTDELFLKK